KGRQVEIRLERPSMHDLPALLLDRHERDERTFRGEVGFFAEFPPCGGKEIRARLGEPLGDGPHALILARPEGAARMGKQNLKFFPAPVHQEAGADFRAATHWRHCPLTSGRPNLRLSTAGLAKWAVIGCCLHDFVTITPIMPASSPRAFRAP